MTKQRFIFTVRVPCTAPRTRTLVARTREEADGMFERLFGFRPDDADYLWIARKR